MLGVTCSVRLGVGRCCCLHIEIWDYGDVPRLFVLPYRAYPFDWLLHHKRPEQNTDVCGEAVLFGVLLLLYCQFVQTARVGAEQRRGSPGGGRGGCSGSALLKGGGGDPRHGVPVHEGGVSFKYLNKASPYHDLRTCRGRFGILADRSLILTTIMLSRRAISVISLTKCAGGETLRRGSRPVYLASCDFARMAPDTHKTHLNTVVALCQFDCSLMIDAGIATGRGTAHRSAIRSGCSAGIP